MYIEQLFAELVFGTSAISKIYPVTMRILNKRVIQRKLLNNFKNLLTNHKMYSRLRLELAWHQGHSMEYIIIDSYYLHKLHLLSSNVSIYKYIWEYVRNGSVVYETKYTLLFCRCMCIYMYIPRYMYIHT